MESICCIFNLAPHYSKGIFKLMDQELGCHFYLGDRWYQPIELLDYNELKGFKGKLNFKLLFNKFYWLKGSTKVALKDYKHFIITGEPYCLSTWLILLILRIRRRKIYLWTHGWYGDESKTTGIIKRMFFSFADYILLYGDHARKLMLNEGFKENELVCIYNSLNYDLQSEIRKNLRKSTIYREHFRNDFPTIIYTGRIKSDKRIDLLLEAIHYLKKSDFHCNLVLVGEAVDDFQLKELIEFYNLSKFVWEFGACYDEEVLAELFYNSVACVSPGNVGLTAIHSLTYGTPVITHDNIKNQGPEYEAIEEGITGSFFKENSIQSLVESIKFWIGSPTRLDKAREEAVRVIDQKFNPHYQLKVIKDLIGKH